MSRWQWGLPLVTKELLEQSARRRTYIVRVVFVALLCYFAVASMQSLLRATTPLTALGQGQAILRSLVDSEFQGIYLFLPAMACSVFTMEKERNTLALLFLTRLGPWTIIWEKLLSRLLPMLMFLCCALPIMAFTYSLGGLSPFQLFISAYFLLLALFQTACIAVMCSALAHSTASAFVQTYVAIFVIGLILPFIGNFIPYQLLESFSEILFGWTVPAPTVLGQRLPAIYVYGVDPQVFLQTLSPTRVYSSLFNNVWNMPGTRTPWVPAIVFGLPSLASGFGCLLVTRWALYRRAFVAPSNPLLKFFRGIDKIFFWAHRNVGFDIKLVREADTLPGDEPIAWREVSKRSLGQFRYLVRIMLPLMFPVIFVGTFAATTEANDWARYGGTVGLSPLVLFLWAVSLVLIAVAAANAVPLERTRQTWDVLRSMPLSGQDMLRQKLRGVRRLQWVCSIPVFSAIGLQAWWRYLLLDAGLTNRQPGMRFPDDTYLWWEYLIGAVAIVMLYSEIAKWIAMWCGLMIRNSMRAILTSVMAIVAYGTVPYIILLYAIMLFMQHPVPQPIWDIPAIRALAMICPVSFGLINQVGDLRTLSSLPLLPATVHLLIQGALLWLLRGHILRRAEWYLGRIGDPRRQHKNSNSNADSVAAFGEDSGGTLPHVAGAAT